MTKATLHCMRKQQHWLTPLNPLRRTQDDLLAKQWISVGWCGGSVWRPFWPGQSKHSVKVGKSASHGGVGWVSRSVPWAEYIFSFSAVASLSQNKYPCSSSWEAAEVLRRLPVEVRGLVDQVEVLIRIWFVVPVSSCEAERSLSARLGYGPAWAKRDWTA